MARPKAITEEIMQTLETAFHRGMVSIESACAIAGISKSTYYKTQAEDEEFSDRMKQARSRTELAALNRIREIGESGNWQALAWWLERTRPDRYSLRARVDQTVTVKDDRADDVDRAIRELVAEMARHNPEASAAQTMGEPSGPT